MKMFIFLFPILLFVIFLCIKLVFPVTYISLIQEDSLIEYAQAFFYFLSSMLSGFLSIKFGKNRMSLHGVLYGILAIGLLFTALEEISWGQRIFNIANPQFFEKHNVQNEISFHNLDIIQIVLHRVYILVGAYGSFAWVLLHIFEPKGKMECRHIVNFIVLEWFISSYFFFVFFIYTLLDYIIKPHAGGFLLWRDQEPMELLLSLGFLVFVLTNYIKLRVCLARRVNAGRNRPA